MNTLHEWGLAAAAVWGLLFLAGLLVGLTLAAIAAVNGLLARVQRRRARERDVLQALELGRRLSLRVDADITPDVCAAQRAGLVAKAARHARRLGQQ